MRWRDQTARAALLMVACLIALAACATNGSPGAPDGVRADTAARSVNDLRLTDQVSGWTEEAGSYAAFDASTLFNLINGGAQPHVDRGLVEGIYQILTCAAGRRVELLAEDFGSAASAQTMYAYVQGQVADALSLPGYPAAATGDVVLGGAVFHAVFDRFYFKLTFTGYDTTDRQSLLADAGAFVVVYDKLTKE